MKYTTDITCTICTFSLNVVYEYNIRQHLKVYLRRESYMGLQYMVALPHFIILSHQKSPRQHVA